MNYTNDYTDNMDEIEIDLIAFLWRLAEQWKLILLVGLMAGVLVSAGKFVKDSRAYASATQEELTEEDIGDIEKELKPEERDAVDGAVQLKLQNDALEEYTESSLLFDIDPYHEQAVLFLYEIKGTDEESSTVMAQKLSAEMSSTEAMKQIAKAIHFKRDPSLIRETITIELSTSDPRLMHSQLDSCVIKAVGKVAPSIGEASYIKAMEDTMNSIIEESEYSKNTTLLYKKIDTVVDTELWDKQATALEKLRINRTTLDGLITAFLDEQKKVYEDKVKEAVGENDKSDKSDDEESEITVEAPSFSAKYACLGIFMGIFLYACALFVYIILSKKVREENASGVFARDKIISIRLEDGSPAQGLWGKLLCDPFVRKIRLRKALPLEEQIRNAAAQIKILTKHSSESGIIKGNEAIMLAMKSLAARHSSVATEIASELKKYGIRLDESTVNVADVEDVIEKTSGTEYVYMVCECNDTMISDVRDLKRILRDNGGMFRGVIIFN